MNGDPSSRRWSGRPWQPPAARRDEWFLLCPVLFFAVYFVFVFNAELGIRYALVVFPLIHVFGGSPTGRTAAARPPEPGRRGHPRGLDRGTGALLSGEALEFRGDRLLTATVGAERPLGVTLEALNLE